MARCKPKQDENGKYLHNGQAAKRGLNKAIGDAAWGELKQKVKSVAEKSGVLFHEINPKHTSQECSCCGYISPTNRDKERFLCEACGHFADADVDAAVVIRQRGLKELGINLPKLLGVSQKVTVRFVQSKPERGDGWRRCSSPKGLSLYSNPTPMTSWCPCRYFGSTLETVSPAALVRGEKRINN